MLSNLIKNIDYVLSSCILYLFPNVLIRKHWSKRFNLILVIRPGGIGDAILLLPTLKQLSKIYPDAKIEILAECRNAEVFNWLPGISAVWRYDKPAEFAKLFTRKFDLVIDTEQWYRLSAVVARLLRPSRLIGFATNERLRLLTDGCPYARDEYEADVFRNLLAPLTGKLTSDCIEDANIIQLPVSHYRANRPYVVIFPGASVSAKQWPVGRFAEVAGYCEKSGFDVVVLGGKSDSSAAGVVTGSLSNCCNLAGSVSLTDSAAVVSGASLMISGDTGLLHVAQLQGVPTVALFGPSDPVKWNRKSDMHVVVSAGADCAPCSCFGTIPRCPYDYKCMQNITVTMVIEAVNSLLPKIRGDHSDRP